MANVANTNFLQPSGFKLVINRQKFANLEWFAQSFDHPSVSVQSADNIGYSRITTVPMIGDKLEYPEVTFNVILDENMDVYDEAYQWMKRLVEKKYVSQTSADDENIASECDMTLIMLNSNNVKQKSFIYRNAFPVNIGNISMGSDQEPTPILVPISFNYTYFDIA